MNSPYNFLDRIAIWLIKLYQKTLSFDHGPLKHYHPNGFCRFYPTCSQYGIEAIQKHGIIKGGIKTIWRIMRCNPWNKGGNDPVV
jgi:putative membrane protein insertion efficiency factor